MALTLLHDVAHWPKGAHREERENLLKVLEEYGISKAEFRGYWDLDPIALAENPEIKISCYYRPDNLSYLFIAANISGRSITTRVTIDSGQFAFKTKKIHVISEGHGINDLSVHNPSFSLTVPPKDFKWITLKQDWVRK